jgi:hypothetical protein
MMDNSWWWELPLLAVAVICGIGELRCGLRRNALSLRLPVVVDDLWCFSFLPALIAGLAASWAVFHWWLGWHWWWVLLAAVPGTVLIGYAVQLSIVVMLAPIALDYQGLRATLTMD